MRNVALLILFVAACKSNDTDESPLVTDNQRAEIQKSVQERMDALPTQVQVSESKRDDVREVLNTAGREIVLLIEAYRSNPTEKQLAKSRGRARRVFEDLKVELQPHMTSAQLNNLMVIYLQAIDEVLRARAES